GQLVAVAGVGRETGLLEPAPEVRARHRVPFGPDVPGPGPAESGHVRAQAVHDAFTVCHLEPPSTPRPSPYPTRLRRERRFGPGSRSGYGSVRGELDAGWVCIAN